MLSHWKARKSERVTEGSTQKEMKTAASRLRSSARWRGPLRAASSASRPRATAAIRASGHSPEKTRRAVSPPRHVHDGKMKEPRSKLNASTKAITLPRSPGSSKP